LVLALGASSTATSTTLSQWAPTGPSGLWSDVANWWGVVPNAAGAVAEFDSVTSSTVRPSVDAPVSVGSIVINDSSGVFRFGGNETLTFDQPGMEPASVNVLSRRSSVNVTLATPVAIADGEELIVTVSPPSLFDWQGAILSPEGDVTLVGNGTFAFSGDNTGWNGNLEVHGGRLNATASSLGGTAGRTAILAGGVLQLNQSSGEPLLLENATIEFGDSALTYSGDIEIAGDVTFERRFVISTTSISGAISGDGNLDLTVVPTGNIGTFATFELSGDNTYTGLTTFGSFTTVNRLNIRSTNALGSPATGTVIQNGEVTIDVDIAEPLDIRGGTVTFSGGASTTGEIQLSGGQLRLNDSLPASIVLDNRGSNPEIVASGGISLAGGVTGAGELRIRGAAVVDTVPLAHQGGLRVLGSAGFNDPGLVLSIANTYTGDTVIESSVVRVNHPQAFGVADTPIQVLGGLRLNAAVDRDFVVNGTMSIDAANVALNSTIRLTNSFNMSTSPTVGGVGRYTGPILLDGVGDFRTNLNGGMFEGVISGSVAQLNLVGSANALVLDSNNTYRGVTVSRADFVDVNAPQALGSPLEGTVVRRGQMSLNVPVDEPITVQDLGQVVVNVQQSALPRIFGTLSSQNGRSQRVTINHVADYDEQVDLVQGTLAIAADTTLGSVVVRDQASIQVAEGATLTIQDRLLLHHGRLQGRIAGIGEFHKVTGRDAVLFALPDFAGDIIVEQGRLRVVDPASFGTNQGATYIGPDAMLELSLSGNRVVTEDIYLDNATGTTLLPGLLISRATNESPTVELAGLIDVGSRGSSIGTGPSNSSSIAIALTGAITGRDLILEGDDTTFLLSTPNANHTGATIIDRAGVTLFGVGRLNNTSAVTLRDAGGGILRFDNQNMVHNDRLPDHVPIHMQGGAIWSRGTLDETIGPVILDGGVSTLLEFVSSELTVEKHLAITSIERSMGSTASIQTSAGAEVRLLGDIETTAGVIPWLIVEERTSSSSGNVGFGVIGSRGFEPAAITSSDIASATANDRVALTETTGPLTGDVVAASLQLNGNTLDLGGNTLQLRSGGMILGFRGSVVNGTLTTGQQGGNEIIVHGVGTMGANIQEADGQTLNVTFSPNFTGSAAVELTGSNNYSGMTTVNNGSLVVAAEGALPQGSDLSLYTGSLILDYAPTETRQFGTIRLATGSLASAQGFPNVGYNELIVESGGTLSVRLVGDGTIRKTSGGAASKALDTGFTGQVIVEEGELSLGGSTQAPIVVEGGRLGFTSLANSNVVLSGGDLLLGRSTFTSFTYRLDDISVQVDEPSRIVAQGPTNISATMRGSLAGTADLRFTALDLTSTSFFGNSSPLRAEISIESANTNFSGDVTIDTVAVSIRETRSLGSGQLTIGHSGSLRLSPTTVSPRGFSLLNDVHLAGGDLFGTVIQSQTPRLLGELHVADHSTIANVDVVGVTHLADRSVLATYGGTTRLLGGITVGGYTEIEYGLTEQAPPAPGPLPTTLQLGGIIRSAATDAVLNLRDRGLSEANLNVSLNARAGESLTIQHNGIVTPIVIAGSQSALTGNGSIGNEIILGNAATLAPGESIGTLTVGGDFIFDKGSTYVWEIASGAMSGITWDRLVVGEQLSTSATVAQPWRLRVRDLTGAITLQDSEWEIATTAEFGIFDFSAVDILAPELEQRLGADNFMLTLQPRGNSLYLVMTVPEPSSALIVIAALGVLLGGYRAKTQRRQ
jgi:autotransporter-associated beta strand protein